MKEKKVLGIIGGLGPMASAYFYELLCERTKVSCDQDHIDLVITSKASTPDRTAYLTGKSSENPESVLKEEALKLEKFGCDFICITCNTSHCFINSIRAALKIPVISMIEETARFLYKTNAEKVGIMATEGTVSTGIYGNELNKYGIEAVKPDKEEQKAVTSLIYDEVKQGREPSLDKFYTVVENLKSGGCDRVILGCTELSVINRKIGGSPFLCDAMEVLAYKAIILSGGEPFGFPESFDIIEAKTVDM